MSHGCKPGDMARFIVIGGRNDGRIVSVVRPSTLQDKTTEGVPFDAPYCWVVTPLQPLWTLDANWQEVLTMDSCIVPDKFLTPIRGLPEDHPCGVDIDLWNLAGAAVVNHGVRA